MKVFSYIMILITCLLVTKGGGCQVTEGKSNNDLDTLVLESGDTLLVYNLSVRNGAVIYTTVDSQKVYMSLTRVKEIPGVDYDGSLVRVLSPVRTAREPKGLNQQYMTRKNNWFFTSAPLSLLAVDERRVINEFNNSSAKVGLEYFFKDNYSILADLGVGLSPSTQFLRPAHTYVTYYPAMTGIDRVFLEGDVYTLNLDYSLDGGLMFYSEPFSLPVQVHGGFILGYGKFRSNSAEVHSYYNVETTSWGGDWTEWERDSVIVRQELADFFTMRLDVGADVSFGQNWMVQLSTVFKWSHAMQDFGAGSYKEYRDEQIYGDRQVIDYHSTRIFDFFINLKVKRRLAKK